MTSRIAGILALVTVIALPLVPPAVAFAAGQTALPLVKVTDKANLAKYTLADSKVAIAQTTTGPALQVDFGNKQPWPNIKFDPAELGYPANWSSYGYIAVTATNTGTDALRINLRVDSKVTKNVGRQGGFVVPAGQTMRLLMRFGGGAPIIGMGGQPPLTYDRQTDDAVIADNRAPVDAAHITQFQIFLAKPEKPNTVLVHSIELLKGTQRSSVAFVDQFGQYSGADWPGKLHDAKEFPERIHAEQEYFKTHPPLADRDKYGGWKDGPQRKATGHFRVEKVNGKWWLVDPDGKLFWSNGIDCVRFNDATIVAGREKYFEWLPGPGDPLGKFYSGNGTHRMYDFFQANTYRKYGKDFTARFYDETMQRLLSWGFNTIGNWSSEESWQMHKVPYTMPVGLSGIPRFLVSSHLKAGVRSGSSSPIRSIPSSSRFSTRRSPPANNMPTIRGCSASSSTTNCHGCRGTMSASPRWRWKMTASSRSSARLSIS